MAVTCTQKARTESHPCFTHGARKHSFQLRREPFLNFGRLSRFEPRLRIGVACLFHLAIVVLAQTAIGAPFRVATWNLREPVASATDDSSSKSPEARIQEAAASLGKLDPDVVILQQVRDWQMCQQVVQALQPGGYSVQVCSAFRDARTGTASRQQIAILSKRKAYFSWSEPWRAEGRAIAGGFTFAALRDGKQRIGLFAVEIGESMTEPRVRGQDSTIMAARKACLQQWLHEVGSFEQWVTNRIEAVVIAGGLSEAPVQSASTAHSADEIEFASTLLSAPLQNPTLLPPDSVLGGMTNYLSARLNPDADSLTGVVLDRWPAICDVELLPTIPSQIVAAHNDVSQKKAAAPEASGSRATESSANPGMAASEVAKPKAEKTAIPLPAPQTGQVIAPGLTPKWFAGIAVAVFVVVIAVSMRGRRRPVPSSRGQTMIALGGTGGNDRSSSGAVIITTQSVSGSAADPIPTRPIVHIESESDHWRRRALAAEQRADKNAEAMRRGLLPAMRRWLKEKLTRKLIADRADLLETQQAAALKAMAVDERLSRVELQIQQQNVVYERRIAELTRELEVAKEENRELIRAKIAQVKAEMEAARLRALQQK